MKRTTITIPDDLETRLNDYLESQAVAPSLSKVMQTALKRFLDEAMLEQELAKRGYKPPSKWPVTFPKAANLTGQTDISVNRDSYLAEAFGLWQNRDIDSLSYQQSLRDEWE